MIKRCLGAACDLSQCSQWFQKRIMWVILALNEWRESHVFFWHENMFVVFVQHGVVTPSVRTYYIDVSERFRSIKVECVFFTVALNLFVRYAYSVRLSDLHKLQIFMQWLQWYTLFAYDRKLNTYTVKSSVLHVQCHLSIHHQDTRRAIPSFQRNCRLSCQLYRHQCCPGQLAVAPMDVQL